MATIGPISIAADTDDGEIGWTGGGWLFYQSGETGNVAYIGDYDNDDVWAFFRFILPSAVPAGATFDTAQCKLELYGKDAWNWVDGTSDLIVYATDGNNPAAPTGTANRPSGNGGDTTLTTSFAQVDNVTWSTAGYNSLIGAGANTIAAILDELHTSYTLDSGDAIVIWVKGNNAYAGAATGRQVGVEDYSHADSNPAKLTIVYTEAGGSVPLKKILNTYRQRRA